MSEARSHRRGGNNTPTTRSMSIRRSGSDVVKRPVPWSSCEEPKLPAAPTR